MGRALNNIFRIPNLLVVIGSTLSSILYGQVADSILFVPIGTERIDTIRFDSLNTIKSIEYIAHDKVLKRIYFTKEQTIRAACCYDEIGRTKWDISWYASGNIQSLWYHNMEIGQSWLENGTLDAEAKIINDTCIETYYYESAAVRKIVKKLPGYDSTHYYYLVTYCENGFKTSEDFSGKTYWYKTYYCNGKKRIIAKKGARRNYIGKFRKWNENGILVIKGQFAADEKHTNYTTIQDQGFGQKEGTWKYFDDKGKLIKIEKYKNGKLISKKEKKEKSY